jgi:serine/threonine protein kinase
MDEETIGRMLVDRGLLTPEELEEALGVCASTGRALAAAVVELRLIDRVQLEDALALLERRVRFCARCCASVLVPRSTARGEICPRCLERVEWREEKIAAQIEDLDAVVQLTRDDLPPEVQAARSRPECLLGKFVLLDELGRGSLGIVRRAWDTLRGAYVALKFIKEPSPEGSSDDPRDRRERHRDLLKEARAALRLRHEHIVPVHDVGSVGDQFYISMECIEGDTLGDHCHAAKRRGTVSPLYEDPAFYLGALRDVANAIYYAHTFSHPIIHCDLKPDNILISVEGVAYVLDFGLAQHLEAPPSPEIEMRGTPCYMAPEQVMGRNSALGVWTDVYGLGGILYQLLAGKPAFTGKSSEVLARTLRMLPTPPSQLLKADDGGGSAAPPALDTAFPRLEALALRCLDKEPGRRCASARDFAAELEDALADLAATAPKAEEAASPPEKPMEFLRRLAARLNTRRPVIGDLATPSRTFAIAEVIKATPQLVVIFDGVASSDLRWSELPRAAIEALAAAAGLTAPADRAALEVFHARGTRPS